MQTIERATIERMKRRHGNINNEILMEKRVSMHYLISITRVKLLLDARRFTNWIILVW